MNPKIIFKLVLTVVLFCTTTSIQAQYTSIPDANFEAALEALGYDDISGDGQVPTSSINTVTTLDVSNLSITDLTGIEDFTALTTLNCSDNALSGLDVSSNINLDKLQAINCTLTAIDVSANTLLTDLAVHVNFLNDIDVSANTELLYLSLYNNELTNIDVSALSKLKVLDLTSNELTAIDVSNNVLLEEIFVNENNLESLDFSANTALTILDCSFNNLTYINLRNGNNTKVIYHNFLNNVGLSCMHVDDVTFSTNNWTNIDDSSAYTDTGFCRYTAIPDANFEAALSAYDDIANDGQIPTASISGLTTLNIANNSIADLTGIEDFISLVELNASINLLTAIDISTLASLERLYIFNNQLTTLDITNNTQITELDLFGNDLTALDTSQNVNLQEAYIDGNAITSLDFTTNTALTRLDCSNNNLSALDLRNGANNSLSAPTFTGNDNLYCIYVDSASYSASNWTRIDSQTSFAESGFCRYTAISDSNFEAALEALGYDDITSDGQVPTSLIEGVTSLNVSNKNIADLTGIEDFVALTSLRCNSNALTTLDLSSNTELESVLCGINSLTSINVSSNTKLRILSASSNQLSSIDVSNNTLLEDLNLHLNASLSTIDLSNNPGLFYFYAEGSSLQELDLSNNPVLEEVEVQNAALTSVNIKNGNNGDIINFDVTGNPGLYCVTVDDSSAVSWASVDAQVTFTDTNYCDYTQIPDANFEAALEALGYDDISGDGQVPTELIENVTTLNLFNKSISDLTGIGDFTALTELNALLNNLGTIDVSNNTALETVELAINPLGTLDLSANVNLKSLSCYSCQLTSIDLSTNTLLTDINVNQNSLSSLDISNNTELVNLTADENQLTGLDTSKNLKLKDLRLDRNNINALDLSNNTSLELLWCNTNNLTSIDLSNNVLLYEADLDSNAISSIDLSKNTVLGELYLRFNPTLSELNLNNNTALIYVEVDSCDLRELQIANGNNTNITYFSALDNPNLTCILVDDAAYSTTNWTNIDAQTSFSETGYCNYTQIPDTNFEAALEALGYDDISGDGQVPTALIEVVTSLDVVFKSISDLSGIEDFTALTYLDCSFNSLSSIDLSNNIALEELNLESNNLTAPDISNLINLSILKLGYNDIQTIDLSNNTLLSYLSIRDNSNLNSLDVSKNTLLTLIQASNCVLTNLDVSNQPNLQTIILFNNQLTTIDLSNNLNVQYIYISGNNFDNSLDFSDLSNLEELEISNCGLTGLNLKNGNNSNILYIEAINNPDLTCILVDDATYSTTNWTNIDAQTSFSDTFCDTTAPTVVCQNITVQLDETGNVSITAQDIDNGSTDDGTIASIVIDKDAFDCANIGNNTVTLTVTDDAGNSDSCTATVTVQDTIDPEFETATLPADEDVTFNNAGDDAYILDDYTAGVNYSDNCEAIVKTVTISQSPVAGTELAEGDHDITITITDSQGNTVDHVFTLTVSQTLAVEDNVIDGLSVYPNPTSGKLFISLQVEEVKIYNMTGQQVLQSTANQLDLSSLKTGVYFAHIFTEKGNDIIRILKN